ncbi:ABC transporter ATP-binding protein/permease [Pseudomonas rubra]|uniref:ABC transporter ATP-binding protein/permease n=1 Tax=Pseudomonas rubra TaxID=2942627 RepID=A0ABT5P5U8_9PSED|nr:ABC transporter ATP-binding protein/permease [Pseudomonas rubra]MDD1013663.1 ABC transporter ATP-binding protein/permease [Pseudomonas rubra]MDD1040018.1 ABC transporter ATP-binding protein/permease [Pseudomonas rubra]MDD1155976.1 ABC transporter ATP-binding protein/permease [Pseudomonas rubra]
MKRLRQFWAITRPFWRSRAALPAWLLLAAVISLTLLSVWFSVRMNQWNGDFYNALQALDGKALYPLLYSFVGLVTAMILVVVYADYLRKLLLIRWRAWLTEHWCARWLSADSHHYRLQLTGSEPDNPDQRIADDVRLMVEHSLKLLVSFTRSVVSLVSFVSILWSLSGAFTFSLAGHTYHLPGYMVWTCLAYTLVGIALTHWIGNALQGLNVGQQRREADYRSALMLRRRHADAIAGQHGEVQEREALRTRFAEVVGNWYRLMRAERNLAFFTVGYQQTTLLAPFFFALPKFLSGELQLGGLMRIQSAFGQVAAALSWFIYAYRDIAAWSACVERLHGFASQLDEPLPATAATPIPRGTALLDARLAVQRIDGSALLPMLHLRLEPGTLSVLRGRSGLGKSTLLRALAGYWPHIEGQLTRRTTVFWMPQDPYLGDGSLADLLAYPSPSSAFSEERLHWALDEVGMGHWRDRLAHCNDWMQRLSGGERQRLLVARLLLNRPALLLLDESLSALDPPAASSLLGLLRRHLADSAILLASHQPHLAEHADQVVDLDALTRPSEEALAHER